MKRCAHVQNCQAVVRHRHSVKYLVRHFVFISTPIMKHVFTMMTHLDNGIAKPNTALNLVLHDHRVSGPTQANNQCCNFSSEMDLTHRYFHFPFIFKARALLGAPDQPTYPLKHVSSAQRASLS